MREKLDAQDYEKWVLHKLNSWNKTTIYYKYK
jgi:hypothetical protein